MYEYNQISFIFISSCFRIFTYLVCPTTLRLHGTGNPSPSAKLHLFPLTVAVHGTCNPSPSPKLHLFPLTVAVHCEYGSAILNVCFLRKCLKTFNPEPKCHFWSLSKYQLLYSQASILLSSKKLAKNKLTTGKILRTGQPQIKFICSYINKKECSTKMLC